MTKKDEKQWISVSETESRLFTPDQIKQYNYLLTLLNRIPKSEAQLQSKCSELLYWFYPNDWKRLVCVHNNSIRANTQGFGIVPGVADMFWLRERMVIFLEFKFGKNKQSQVQLEWEFLCNTLKHPYYILDSEVAFWQIIEFNQPREADILKLKYFA